jgi:hypothetical protein
MCFRTMSSYRLAFQTMGASIFVSALLTLLIQIPGQSTFLSRLPVGVDPTTAIVKNKRIEDVESSPASTTGIHPVNEVW